MDNLITILVFLVVAALTLRLEVLLSKKGNKWPGLVLPLLTFGGALSVVLARPVAADAGTLARALTLLGNLILTNIPTFVLLAVYVGVREKMKIDKRFDSLKKENREP